MATEARAVPTRTRSPRYDDQTIEYVPLSRGAILGVLLALGSLLLAVGAPAAGAIPGDFLPSLGIACGVIGIGAAMMAVVKVKRSEGALGGRLLARVGLALSLIGSIGGIAFQKYLYAAEVPDGYERLEWRVLNPADQGRVPPQIANLDGRKVYVRGFMYPQERTSGLRSFLLCQDNGVCCFGGQPAPSDNISVVFAEGPGVEYRQSSVAIAGTLRVYPPDPGIRVPMFVPVGPRGLVFVPPRAGRPFPLFVLDGELFR